MSSFTPGPWGVETLRTSCGVCHKIGPWTHKWRAGETMSACVYDDYPSPPEGTDTMLANARLIAAAPEILAALLDVRALISEAAQTGFNWKDGDWTERLYASQQVTSAAIAKALGDAR